MPEVPIEPAQEPIRTLRKKKMGSPTASLSGGAPDRNLLVAYFAAMVSAQYSLRTACRCVFATITFAVCVIPLSSNGQVTAVEGVAVLLSVFWFMDDARRELLVSSLYRQIVNVYSRSNAAETADELIRGSYYGSASMFRHFLRFEPILWGIILVGVAGLNKFKLMR